MKRALVLTFLVAAVLFSGCLEAVEGGGIVETPSIGEPGGIEIVSFPRIPVKIVVNYGDRADTVYANVTEGTSLFEIMDERFNITYDEYPELGALITGINGVEQSPEMFWIFYVNEEMAAVGVSAYFPQADDEILFSYGMSPW